MNTEPPNYEVETTEGVVVAWDVGAVSSDCGCAVVRVCGCEEVAVAVDAAKCCAKMVCCLFNLYLEFSCGPNVSCTMSLVSTSFICQPFKCVGRLLLTRIKKT